MSKKKKKKLKREIEEPSVDKPESGVIFPGIDTPLDLALLYPGGLDTTKDNL